MHFHKSLQGKPPYRLQAARVKAWEGKNPGVVRVLLANPRWERRFAKFLELSGVGRVMADGTDEDGAYAARMDEWVAWEAVERSALGARDNLSCVFPMSNFPFIILL
jgi:hypothetical protein